MAFLPHLFLLSSSLPSAIALSPRYTLLCFSCQRQTQGCVEVCVYARVCRCIYTYTHMWQRDGNEGWQPRNLTLNCTNFKTRLQTSGFITHTHTRTEVSHGWGFPGLHGEKQLASWRTLHTVGLGFSFLSSAIYLSATKLWLTFPVCYFSSIPLSLMIYNFLIFLLPFWWVFRKAQK